VDSEVIVERVVIETRRFAETPAIIDDCEDEMRRIE
jgi:hypothetical protein